MLTRQTSLIAGIGVLIFALSLLAIAPIVSNEAFAGGHHHHHHHHHHQHGHHSSVRVHQSVDQANLCDHSSCSNSGSNSASVSSGHQNSSHVRVDQSINQANACSNSDCTNTATNTANIH